MSLFSTKYPNQERSVSGTYTVDDEDSILLCDTSSASVTINLLDIPSGYWNTVYKLYVVDNSNNCATNNITITAPAGFTINDASTLVLNKNGTSIIVRISANTKYVVAESIPVTDTGWLNLQGFSWITTASLVPQYRIINKAIFFRRNIIIPLLNGSVVLNYASDVTYGTTYVNTALVTPFVGSGGVTAFSGGCYFNNSNPVMQLASHYPDANYSSSWIIGTKKQVVSVGGGPAIGLYHSPYILTLTTGGLLKLETLNSIERAAFPSQSIGNSLLRQISSKTILGDYVEDFNDVTGSLGATKTFNGSSIQGYDFNQINKGAYTHTTTFDPADETLFGAMEVPLMGFNAFN